MFLCDKCHPKDCPRRWIEDMPFGRSAGSCEKCGKYALCVDCQGYKSRKRDAQPGAEP